MNASIVLAVLVVGGLLIYMALTSPKKPKPYRGSGASNDSSPSTQSGFDADLVKNKWMEIGAMQHSGPSGLKSALVEADKLLDYVMKAKGFTGVDMGGRLKSGGDSFSNLNAIWNAHKLRNMLAHEVDHDLVPDEVKRAITDLGQGIRDLGVLI